jgi:hypothetical protein
MSCTLFNTPRKLTLAHLLFRVGAWQWGTFADDFLVLGQYGLLDHHSRLSIGRKSNIPVGAVPQLLGWK